MFDSVVWLVPTLTEEDNLLNLCESTSCHVRVCAFVYSKSTFVLIKAREQTHSRSRTLSHEHMKSSCTTRYRTVSQRSSMWIWVEVWNETWLSRMCVRVVVCVHVHDLLPVRTVDEVFKRVFGFKRETENTKRQFGRDTVLFTRIYARGTIDRHDDTHDTCRQEGKLAHGARGDEGVRACVDVAQGGLEWVAACPRDLQVGVWGRSDGSDGGGPLGVCVCVHSGRFVSVVGIWHGLDKRSWVSITDPSRDSTVQSATRMYFATVEAMEVSCSTCRRRWGFREVPEEVDGNRRRDWCFWWKTTLNLPCEEGEIWRSRGLESWLLVKSRTLSFWFSPVFLLNFGPCLFDSGFRKFLFSRPRYVVEVDVSPWIFLLSTDWGE